MIEIAEFTLPAALNDLQLRERALHSKVARSRQFLATIDGAEAGYLSVDDRSDLKLVVLYDLLVLLRFRRKGIGSALVANGENLARALGYNRVRVLPRAFDGSVGQRWLESWYVHRGYKLAGDGTEEYEKQFDSK